MLLAETYFVQGNTKAMIESVRRALDLSTRFDYEYWLRLLARTVTRRPEDSPLAEMTTASRVSVTLDRTLPWEVDGGDRERTDSYEITCRPSAIRVCQPSAEQ
jgi:diacylglycerol kinase family enzyme